MLKLQSLGLNPNTAKVLETLAVSAKKNLQGFRNLGGFIKVACL